MDVPFGQLALLAGVLRTIEAESFDAERLSRVRAALGGTTRPASVEIARLRRLVSLLDSRRDMMFAPIAASLAWATQIAGAIDAWRARVGPHVVRWIDAVGEFESLAAMATYAAEHPDHVFPAFDAGAASIRATRLGHPLLGADAIGNDIAIGGADSHVFIVSGSNMSGKSTFLRAIGLNVVFAQAGLPVRAASFALAPMAVGASIRIVDSLTEGRSKFFAEIGRLKLIVDLARERRGAALFLLDEILAGTNSHDRLRGAEGVIAGLAALGAIGLVTTHDLALGDVAGRLSVPAVNVHFADEFDAGGLHFDYRLRPGVVRTSNALALMRAVGLDITEA
jgi:DNA mismatch repair ATPase MutS